jgi:hypothetical protein
MVHISVIMFVLLLCKIIHFDYKLRKCKLTQKMFDENVNFIIILTFSWFIALGDYYYEPK